MTIPASDIFPLFLLFVMFILIPLIAAIQAVRKKQSGVLIALIIFTLIGAGGPAGLIALGYLRDSNLKKVKLNKLVNAVINGPTPEARRDAVLELGQLDGQQHIQTIRRALKDNSAVVQEAAATTLGKLQDAASVESLIAFLPDVVINLRDAAAAALVAIGPASVEPLLKKAMDNKLSRSGREAAVKVLAQIGLPVIEPLLAMIRSSAVDTAESADLLAMMVLPELGTLAVEPLIAALTDSNKMVRYRAVHTLGEIGDPRSRGPLRAALNDSHPEVVAAAAIVLGKAKDTEAVDLLLGALEQPNAFARSAAATALGRIGESRAVQPLIARLADSDATVQEAAAEALKQIGGTEAEQAAGVWWQAETVRRDQARFTKLIHTVLEGSGKDSEAARKELAGLPNREAAIPPIVEHFHQRGNESSYKVAKALQAIGTLAVVDPLLEIFRAAKPSKFAADGSQVEDDKSEDGAPASALVNVPGAIEQLKTICPPDEFERILVRAHNYGDASNPELNAALGEIATPKALGRLLDVLGQHHWPPEGRAPAREALAKAGPQAHPALLAALGRKYGSRKYGMSVKKEVLGALAVSGDEKCASAIIAGLESDESIASEARATLTAIASRHAGIDIPASSGPKPMTLKTIAPTGDPYVDACFHFEFQQFDEWRDWRDLPDAKPIPGLIHNRKLHDALSLTRILQNKLPDFDYGYHAAAVAFGEMGRYSDAQEVLNQGFRLARDKRSLCDQMGTLLLALGKPPEAVMWWIRSVTIQLGTDSRSDFVAFLQLSYFAEQLGFQQLCNRLRREVDQINVGKPRLTPEGANKLYATARQHGTESMKKAFEVLEREFMA